MIPATTPVTAYDPATGTQLTYDQWVPVRVNIDSPDDISDAPATPTSASVALVRCRTISGGKTDRLPEFVAQKLGVRDRTVYLFVPNIYAAVTDASPFTPTPYPDDADDVTKAQIDLGNAQAHQQHQNAALVYPAAARAAILAAPSEPKSLMAMVVAAAAALGYAQGKL